MTDLRSVTEWLRVSNFPLFPKTGEESVQLKLDKMPVKGAIPLAGVLLYNDRR